MRSPLTRGRTLPISKSEERRTLIILIVAACVPVLGAVCAVTLSSHPDLSGLSPLKEQVGPYVILGWPPLLRDHSHFLNARTSSLSGALIQVLGYMTDGAQPIATGQLVKRFVLLPDAGNLLHPAHRFGDQMIAVNLGDTNLIRFFPGRLVWVCGTFQATPGDPTGGEPLYALGNASAELASKDDIRKYFRPY